MKNSFSILVLAMSSFLISGCISVNASVIDYEASENLSLNSKEISELKIKAGAGFILIEGAESSDKIEVTADIKTYGKNYQLTLIEENGNAILIADPNPKDISNWFALNVSNNSPKIDLTIKLPKGISLSIDDGSGNIDVQNTTGHIVIDDGSGSISLKNIKGKVKIEDGSGSIHLSGITNEIDIYDGSGSIAIHNAGSNVKIEDGSGEINIFDIAGKVEIDDGSGELSVTGAQGHVTINDGSGDIKLVALNNGLTILNSGSGGLSMSQVKGNIETD